jgi:hypothetical protein
MIKPYHDSAQIRVVLRGTGAQGSPMEQMGPAKAHHTALDTAGRGRGSVRCAHLCVRGRGRGRARRRRRDQLLREQDRRELVEAALRG